MFLVSDLLLKFIIELWVSVNVISKVFDDFIRDLEFNPRLHQKLIGVLV